MTFNPINYQLIILPKIREGICIFCPFTKIITEGKNYAQAISDWQQKAKKQYGSNFPIPKQEEYLTRKVLTGAATNAQSSEFFLIDFNHDIQLEPVVVVLPSMKVLEAKDVPLGAMYDERVFCSPISSIPAASSKKISKFSLMTLTPNVIN